MDHFEDAAEEQEHEGLKGAFALVRPRAFAPPRSRRAMCFRCTAT